MITYGLERNASRKAADVVASVRMAEPALALLRPEMTPRQYLDILTQKGHIADAVRFLAHAVSKPEAVWWAVQCARSAVLPSAALPPRHAAALSAAEKWLQDPSDDNRRAALLAAQAAGAETPAGLAAIGVFFAGGSLAPPSVPAVPPGEHLTADMVAVSISQAAASGNSTMLMERLAGFLTKGMEIANGASRFPPKK